MPHMYIRVARTFAKPNLRLLGRICQIRGSFFMGHSFMKFIVTSSIWQKRKKFVNKQEITFRSTCCETGEVALWSKISFRRQTFDAIWSGQSIIFLLPPSFDVVRRKLERNRFPNLLSTILGRERISFAWFRSLSRFLVERFREATFREFFETLEITRDA